MNIPVIGKGNVGGGLARLWEQAGHDVTALGRTATEQLIADTGLEPVHVGGLQYAVELEEFLLNVIFPVAQDRQSPFFYRLY
jgi:predicted dinucleotide-binding enzyme